MYIYYCWITVLIPSYQDGIIAGMVKKGYMVGPAAKDGSIIIGNSDQPAAIISLSLYQTIETEAKTNVKQIYTDLMSVLVDIKAYYYSIVVVLASDATWIGSNITFHKEKIIAPPSGEKNNIN